MADKCFGRRCLLFLGTLTCTLVLRSPAAHAIMPDDPGAAAIQFTLNSGQDVKSISPWIYGSNSTSIANRTFDRSGGNRTTGYNWENNASNAGSDWYHHSDYGMANNQSNAPPGSAVRGMIQNAATAGRASLVTIPMAGYVAADGNGTVDETEVAPSPRWKKIEAKKSNIYPGSSLSITPDKNDGYVFTDEFVNWAEDFKQDGQQVWYSLDNEPGLWGEALPAGWQSGDEPRPWENPPYPGVPASSGGRTHPLIHPSAPTFTEMRDKSIAHASAIKDVNPNALVFGGVGYGWNEFTTMQGAPGALSSPSHPGGDQSGEMNYNEYLLQQVRNAEIAQDRKLMDVLDLHWYPEAQGGGIRITENNNSSAVVAASSRCSPARSSDR
ncbi:MAG: glycoside hydrolase family 44 protein [Pirellulales bacterium]